MNSANIKTMTDDQLIERVEYLVQRERELVECLISHLQEIQDRKLYIQMGYTSLFECLVKHFKFSESSAYARTSALKIIAAVPSIAEALNSGEVNLTTLCLAQSFIKKQEKATGEKITAEQKVQLVESIKNKTSDEVKQLIAEIQPANELPFDKVQYLDKDHAQLQATVSKSLLEKVEKLKSLISHEYLDPSYNDLLSLALDSAIEKVEKKKGIIIPPKGQGTSQNLLDETQKPAREATSKTKMNPSTQSFAGGNSRYISRSVKRFAMLRSHGQCEHVHPDGNKCGSRFQLQFDHVKAFSKGGSSEMENIQILCRVHNAFKGARESKSR